MGTLIIDKEVLVENSVVVAVVGIVRLVVAKEVVVRERTRVFVVIVDFVFVIVATDIAVIEESCVEIDIRVVG